MVFPRILCAISGGVDSAIAALLLKRKGFNIAGVFMRNWDLRDEVGHCGSNEDCEYAMKVCSTLDIPFHEINLVKEYWNHVFVPMIEEYGNGNTPNPDIFCNHYVKFDALHQKCKRLVGNDPFVVATGHYARTSLDHLVLHDSSCNRDNALLIGADPSKDQTFFLCQITQQALRRTYFPLGQMHKSEVKKIAKNSDLAYILKRKESMGICFIGKREFPKFIKGYLAPKPGKFICYETGKILGHHDGYYVFTVGQRTKLAGNSIAYVILHKDVHSGDMFVVPGVNHPSMYARSMIVKVPHWIRGSPSSLQSDRVLHCQFRFMHRETLLNCVIHKLDDGYLVVLDQPRRALTVGQFAVFYLGDECLGGARICDVGPSMYECPSRDKVDLATYRHNIDEWSKLIENYEDIINFEQWDITGYNIFKSKGAVVG